MNSIYDPLGFVAPVTLQGRLLIRELTAGTTCWDDPIEKEKEVKWVNWLVSLEALNNLAHNRCYTGQSLKSASKVELVVFCDASSVAIGAVSYLKVQYKDECRSGFVMATSKLAPKPAHTIPRLELCTAVLAVEMAETISKKVDLPLDRTTFYSDSKVMEVINSRLHVEVSTDPETPAVLTPAAFLTQKFDRVSAPEDTLQLKCYIAKEH